MSDAKTLGGIGAILVLLAAVPTVGWLLGIAGFVMMLVAINSIADSLRERGIFNDMMIAVVLSIVGILVGALVIVPTVLNAFANGYFGSGPSYAPAATVTTAQWIAFGTTIGLGLLAAWAIFLVSSVFLRRSYKAMGSRLNVGMFGTAGLLYLIGAATTIIGVGFLMLFVAQILTAVAFFSIPVTQNEQTHAVASPYVAQGA
jgi:uncharacterized membrane protein